MPLVLVVMLSSSSVRQSCCPLEVLSFPTRLSRSCSELIKLQSFS